MRSLRRTKDSNLHPKVVLLLDRDAEGEAGRLHRDLRVRGYDVVNLTSQLPAGDPDDCSEEELRCLMGFKS